VTAIPEDLRAALASRYELRRELGRGGMATVWLAGDLKHHREVAIKVLRPDLAASLGAERFLKEIEIAARLTHPHILALHDSGEAGGFLYYVMPYIEGGSLRQVLERERRLDLDRALGIAGFVADALGYAHRMGVLHRDIKPENILFSQGHPIVADFGIAKAVSTAGGANLTRTGFPLGTPGYMSPEQAAGLTDLDERADVYALAVVVYEMLVGEVPGQWPSDEAMAVGRMLKAPPAHRRALEALPPFVEAALVRAFAVDSERRTATPEELMAGLRGASPSVAVARRVYTEEEVRDLVRLASESEARAPTSGGAMTIGGVQALASEVGIAPERVRAAAAALEQPLEPEPRTLSRRIVGVPTHVRFERVVEGEVPEPEFPVLVQEIGRALGLPGTVTSLGRSVTWTSTGIRSGVQVTVGVRGGLTRISAGENLWTDVYGPFAGITSGIGLGGGAVVAGVTGALGVPLLIPLVLPAWVWGVVAIARRMCRGTYFARSREIERLADRLAALAGELVPRPRLPGS